MKKKINSFTESEIKTLKACIKISYVGQKYGISKKSNYIYRIMRNGVKNEKSKAYQFLTELRNTLNEIELVKSEGENA
ncbi:hypothetical protein [Aquimarina algiphila]|uniref:Uncharacterized protein n=1 Tax=Aquimarina algiphila TaxID=2047982 RepID=A0A554VKZ4_9FLAO|nr:hypothetical protein [Aquimarina algiphila]TSE08756.1 hypothetical protein FOF46_11470 [Aquimarina algiphila]